MNKIIAHNFHEDFFSDIPAFKYSFIAPEVVSLSPTNTDGVHFHELLCWQKQVHKN